MHSVILGLLWSFFVFISALRAMSYFKKPMDKWCWTRKYRFIVTALITLGAIGASLCNFVGSRYCYLFAALIMFLFTLIPCSEQRINEDLKLWVFRQAIFLAIALGNLSLFLRF